MDNSAKMKKNYKLMGTESDPVIIAQRLLNLYRQLHIFSPEKKEAYNKMLLEQPSEIKKTLGSLPGGIVVQQYISDLEAENGIDIDELYDGNTAESNNNDSAKINPMAYSGVSVASDPAVVQGIVDAFKEAIATSEKNRKEDTKELAQTIIALQSKLTQTMMEKQPSGSGGASIASLPRIEEIITGISRAQSELIKEMAQAQTQELSQLISQVLKEIQQMSNQTLINAVQTVHRENLDFFKNKIFSSVSPVPMASTIETSPMPEVYEKQPVGMDDLDNISQISLDGYEDEELFTPAPEPKKAQSQPQPETEAPSSYNEQQSDDASGDEDYEWEYVEDDASGEDYEWEYVEDDGSGDASSNEEYAYVEDTSASGDEDYEWEYVEDDGSEETSPDGDIVEETAADEIPSSDAEVSTDPYTNEVRAEDDDFGSMFLSEEPEVQVAEKANESEGIALNDDFGLSLDDDFGLSADDDFGLSADDDFGLSAKDETVA